jgi:hypothetical protein
MSILNIVKAERAGALLVFSFIGTSGTGKTRTAIEFGYGLANFDTSKMGFIDAENGRGRLYSEVLEKHPTHPTKERWWYGGLYAPFSPSRYVEAILEMQAMGIEVLIIDSYSHGWEGTGGTLDIADTHPKKMIEAKRQHKKLIETALQCNMHVIFCVRAREQMDFTDIKKPKSLGIQPIWEKNLPFEMSASIMMWNEGTSQDVIKCPSELRPFLGRGNDYITSEDGRAVRDWVDGGGKVNPEAERATNELRTISEKGRVALEAAFKALPKAIKVELVDSGVMKTLAASADEYDRQRTDAKPGGAALAGLNDEIGETAE